MDKIESFNLRFHCNKIANILNKYKQNIKEVDISNPEYNIIHDTIKDRICGLYSPTLTEIHPMGNTDRIKIVATDKLNSDIIRLAQSINTHKAKLLKEKGVFDDKIKNIKTQLIAEGIEFDDQLFDNIREVD